AAPVDNELAAALRAEWDAPALQPPVDHGITTPLALGLAAETKVVAVSLRDVKDGISFADSLHAVAKRDEKHIALVASAHLCAALAARAPIPLREQAVALEEQVLGGIRRDVSFLVERADDLETVGASCGAGPLAAIGHCFEGRPAEVVAYDRTFGVGYLVARLDV
ncbi:MAG: hypothetical protein M3161_00060, partial [Actinomycetota bacterium]|nr:hypothetical protein [Actinomycetota bacterium]